MSQIRDMVAHLLEIIDGDTIKVDCDLGFDIWKKNVKVRLAGIDTPELITLEGQKTKKWLEQTLGVRQTVVIRTYTHRVDKYGRVLGDLFLDGKCLNEEMMALGLARSYKGKGPKPWSASPPPLIAGPVG